MANIRSHRPTKRFDWVGRGLLSPHVDAFKQYLTERGYATATFAHCMGAITHFAQWLRRCSD
jgi:hypothetical protein